MWSFFSALAWLGFAFTVTWCVTLGLLLAWLIRGALRLLWSGLCWLTERRHVTHVPPPKE